MDKQMKTSVLAIVGKSSSGKDKFYNFLKKHYEGNDDINFIVSSTTRPKRDYEVDGVDYYFISTEKMYDKVCKNQMAECSSFRDWYYGTERTSLKEEKLNIGIFNLDGVRALKESGYDVKVVCLEASSKERLIRALRREQSPDIEEIFRRWKTDEFDFDGFDVEFEAYKVDTEKVCADDVAYWLICVVEEVLDEILRRESEASVYR